MMTSSKYYCKDNSDPQSVVRYLTILFIFITLMSNNINTFNIIILMSLLIYIFS